MEMLNSYVLTMEHDGKKKDLIYNTNYSFLLGGTHVILEKKKRTFKDTLFGTLLIPYNNFIIIIIRICHILLWLIL